MRQGLIGALTTPNVGNLMEPDVPWALDSGCFGDKWNETKWETTLEKHSTLGNCLFATVPDVVADSEATDERWSRYVSTVTRHGYPAAYVTQDGCQKIPDDADAIFTGGTNDWKYSQTAQDRVAEAKRRGLWCHMGRVNSRRRLEYAAHCGYDSVDGTFLAFGPDTNLPRLLRMLRHAEHPTLWEAS